MEDASGVDLDWFWRGWFYSTDYVDVSLDYVKYFQLNTNNPETEKALQQQQDAAKPEFIGDTRNKESIKETVNERDPNIDDFYGKRDIYAVDKLDKKEYEDFQSKLTPEQKKLLESKKHFYELSFTDKGGLPTPIIIQATFTDGTTEVIRIPAEIWKMDQTTVTKVFIFDKEVSSFQLDPFLESADCDVQQQRISSDPKSNALSVIRAKESHGKPDAASETFGRTIKL